MIKYKEQSWSESRNIQAVGYFCTLKTLFNRLAARATLFYLVNFTVLLRNALRMKQLDINNLLDVLVCSIAGNFYSLFVF